MVESYKNFIDKKQKELKIELDNIDKSSLFNFDFNFEEFFNSLNVIEKLSVSLLIFNYAIISSLIIFISIIYSDYLIKIYDIENKYPKIYKFILYRKKFHKYYLIISFSIIFILIFTEIIFSIAVLFDL